MADVSRLIDDEKVAYYIYVRALRGDDLVGNQAISPKRVADARAEWLGTVKKCADVGIDAAFIRQHAGGLVLAADMEKEGRR